jgi:chromosome segregation ATPase
MQNQPSSPTKSPIKSPSKSPKRSPSPKKQIPTGEEEEDVFAYLDFSQEKAIKPASLVVKQQANPVKNDGLETEKQQDPQELILLYEANTHQMENKMISVSRSLEKLSKEKQTWEVGRKEQSVRIVAFEKQVANLKEELQRAKSEKHVDSSVSLQWSREKEELKQALHAKTNEVQTLSVDLEQKSESLLLSKQELVQEKEKIAALKAIETSNRALLSSQEIEISQLTKMTDWLNQELSLKSSQLLDYRKEKSAQLNKLQSDLETMVQEKSGLESRAQFLQKRCDELEIKLESKMDQLRESENRQISS